MDVLCLCSDVWSRVGGASDSVRTETGGFQRGFGGDVGLGIFRASPGRPGSMTKSSLLSRAPAN